MSLPLDASIQIHTDAVELKPALANLGSYSGLVGRLVRMSTSDWRRTVVVLGVAMLAVLSWMKGQKTPTKTKLAGPQSPQIAVVNDSAMIERLTQEPLRAAPGTASAAATAASTPTPASPSTSPVPDADLFQVKSLESPATAPRRTPEARPANAEEPTEWPSFQGPSGTSVSQDDAENAPRRRVAQAESRPSKRWSRWSEASESPESPEADDVGEDERTELAEEEEELDAEQIADVRQREAEGQYPVTDVKKYPPSEQSEMARRGRAWNR